MSTHVSSHSGRLLALLVLFLLIVSPSVSGGPHPSVPAAHPPGIEQFRQATNLAEKVLKAYGGVEALKKAKSEPYRARGKTRVISALSGAANSFDCNILGKDEKVRVEMLVMGQPSIHGFDGERSWTQFGDWVSQGTETASRRLKEEIKQGLNLLIEIPDQATRLELLGPAAVNGKECDRLKVTAAGGKPTVFYADRKTGLVLRSEYMGTDKEQGVPALQTFDYDDYRPVAGVPTPFKTVQCSGGRQVSETVLDSVETGIAVDDTVFTMPKESSVARLEEGPVTVPFEFIGNEIAVKVRVNNQSDCLFLLDTGASQSVIDKAQAATFGPVSSSNFSITSGSTAVPLSFTKLNTLTIGDVTLDDVTALVTDLSTFARAIGRRPTGLIGANVLRRFLVAIDFPNRKIVLSDPQAVTVPAGAHIVRTSPIFGASALVVSGKVDGKLDLNFLVDTGAAFNNLPRAAIKSLYPGEILPVGQVFGIDGRQVNIGSIRLKSLKLNELTITNPVFALSPQTPGASAGLINAQALGILGNTIWSKFRMTIDYRNERLILERPPQQAEVASLDAEMQRIDLDLLRNEDEDAAIAAFSRLEARAAQAGKPARQALVLARVAGCYARKYELTHDQRFLNLATTTYQTALSKAQSCRDKTAQAQILARWAEFYLVAGGSQADIAQAQRLLARALSLDAQDPDVCAVAAALSLRCGNAAGEKLLDQALMFDPSHWRALWTKYQLFRRRGDTKNQQLVLAQLNRYYPGVPAVVKAGQAATPAAQGKAQPARAGKGSR